MAFTARVVANSVTLEEAHGRTLDFKSACHSIPSIMDIYNLHDVTTVERIGRRHLLVIDMLVLKGMEELGNICEHAKQRHHIIGQYVIGSGGLVQDLGKKDDGTSEFLKQFYTSNYF